MNVKIQSKGIAGGHNTGSCLGYANYLEHENNEKVEAGMMDSTIPFFDPFGAAVNKMELVKLEKRSARDPRSPVPLTPAGQKSLTL